MAPDVATGTLLSILLSFLSAAYIRAVVCKLPKGLGRIVSAAPVFALFAAAPVWFYDRKKDVICVLLASAFLLWWGNFKLLALCWGRGPLENQSKSKSQWTDFLGFTALLVLPVVVENTVTNRKKLPAEQSRDGQVISSGQERRNGQGHRNGQEQKQKPLSTDASVELRSRAQTNGVHPLWDSADVINNQSAHPTVERLRQQPWSVLLRSSLLHAVIFFSLIYLLDLREYLPQVVIQLIYVSVMYTHMMFSFPLLAAFASATLGVRLIGHFDRPWLSQSLADFWGYRWNLTANRVLRDGIYYPAKERLEKALIIPKQIQSNYAQVSNGNQRSGQAGQSLSLARRKIARGVAALTTFVVSGLMHEVLIYYATGEATGEWTTFFTLHGIAFLLEAELVIPLAKHMRFNPPDWVKILVTLSFFLGTAEVLFFPPVIRSGLDRAGIGEFRMMLRSWFGY
jgi:hypothetical protein